jgi:hypothetical protein
MISSARPRPFHQAKWFLAVAIVAILRSPVGHVRAAPQDDLLQKAVNYIFTGRIDPSDGPEIKDRQSCIVVVPDPKFIRYVRYYLSRFKIGDARVSKTYSGPQISYQWEVDGDDVIIEYLKADKKTVDYGFKSAHIPLPGDIDQTNKAIRLIAQLCKVDRPKSPF